MADLMDEFQFKPLTEGLGFHKKADQIKNEIRSANLAREKTSRSTPEPPPRSILNDSREFDASTRDHSRPASQSIADLIASLPPSLDFIGDQAEPNAHSGLLSNRPSFDVQSAIETTESYSGRPQIFQPLAREEYKPLEFKSETKSAGGLVGAGHGLINGSAHVTNGPTVGQFLPAPGSKAASSIGSTVPLIPAVPAKQKPVTSQYRERLDESFSRAFPHAEKAKVTEPIEADDLVPVSGHLGAGLLDGMVVAGVGTILLVCILAITRINLVGMLTNAQTHGPTQFNLVLLFLAVLQMYMVTARSCVGSSLGEWAFDLQIGTDEQQRRAVYPLQVAWRIILVTATGLVMLPLLSLIMRRDLTKYLTGLQTFRRR